MIADSGIAPTTMQFQHWSGQLRDEGFAAIRTGALGDAAAAAARHAGYRCIQELALLEHDLLDIPVPAARDDVGGPAPSGLAVRRPHHRGDAELAAIDVAAFGEEWGLDALGLREVCEATPQHRLRVASGDASIAFAVSGRAGRSGFLQRLAVHPSAQRQGAATLLVRDSLRWMRRWHVARALVNTHVENGPAMALYLRAGFRLLPSRLGVYEWQQ